MNTESIKILRSKIAVSMAKAIQLLKKNNGDVALSENDFHKENIIEICKMTDCDQETAKKEYKICNFDIAKTIERISQKLIVMGTRKFPGSKIGFVLWPENNKGEFYKTVKRNDAFIASEDFDLVLEIFQSVFPIQNPWNNIVEEEFDVIGHNFFDAKTSRSIVEKISLLKPKDEREKAFLSELVKWLNDKLVYADYIVVYGNL